MGTLLHEHGLEMIQSLFVVHTEGWREGFAGRDAGSDAGSLAADGGDEQSSSDDESEAPLHQKRRPGRPRVEDDQPGLMEFLLNFVHSRGQVTLKDKHRLNPTLELFGCPLDTKVRAAEEKGFKLSRTGGPSKCG